MKKRRFFLPTVICFLAATLIILSVLPMTYGGASPLQRFLRFDDGGNFGQTVLDSTAIAIGKKSAIFDINKNGQDGVFIYRLEEEKGIVESYWKLGDGNNATASYIIIKDGVRYHFAMNANGWRFAGSRVCLTDMNRLTENLALILTDKNANIAELETDLNGLTGIDLSEFFDFNVVPTVIRSMIESFGEESFQIVSGYSFERTDFTLNYHFSPANSKSFADKVNSIAQIAYTSKTRSIMNIADIAGGVADFFGYDLFGLLFDADITFSVGAFTGKLISFTYKSDGTTLTAVNRDYGDCDINIESAQLEALMITHIK